MKQRRGKSLELDRAFAEICQAFNQAKFSPVVEGDVTGYLYYLLVKSTSGKADYIHLFSPSSTEKGKKYRPDIVIGKVEAVGDHISSVVRKAKNVTPEMLGMPHEEFKRMVSGSEFKKKLRPRVSKPECLVEVKAFLPDVRYEYAYNAVDNIRKKDLPRLAQARAGRKILFLFDCRGYLAGKRNRIEGIAADAAQSIEIYYTYRDSPNTELKLNSVKQGVKHGNVKR